RYAALRAVAEGSLAVLATWPELYKREDTQISFATEDAPFCSDYVVDALVPRPRVVDETRPTPRPFCATGEFGVRALPSDEAVSSPSSGCLRLVHRVSGQ